jgi:hypothetical protein
VLITGEFERAHSRFIIATRPVEDGKTLCEGIVFAPRGKNALARAILQPIDLALRRFFTHGYLKDEAGRLLGTRYSPGTMIEHDRDMIEYFNWVAALPQSEEEMTMEFEGNEHSLARAIAPELVSEGAQA